MELTKREYVALEILKSMLSSPHTFSSQHTVSDYINSCFSAADDFLTMGGTPEAAESTLNSQIKGWRKPKFTKRKLPTGISKQAWC
jgi:hypothetical protein